MVMNLQQILKQMAMSPRSETDVVISLQVCLRVGGEDELLHLAGLAKEAGLVTGVVRDAGRTQVASRCQKVLNHNLLIFQVEVGSFTVLGIGPAPVDQVN